MAIIDAHLHFSAIQSFRDTADTLSRLDYSAAGLGREYAAAGVAAGIGMGLAEESAGGFPDAGPPNPMLLDLEADRPGFVACCPGINPVRLAGGEGPRELARIEAVLQEAWVVGLKIYAGYYPYHVTDPVYEPVYDLAARHGVAVVMHGGVTYSQRGLLKYAHPLPLDELAVRRRDVTFVLAHLGDPWVMDAAAVLTKNPNVYADLSGLIVGDAAKIERLRKERSFMDHFRRALVYTEDYRKFLFGSDWPLAPVGPYVEFIKDLVPEEAWRLVFCENVLRAFTRLGSFRATI